jgi:hypothetical protein
MVVYLILGQHQMEVTVTLVLPSLVQMLLRVLMSVILFVVIVFHQQVIVTANL